MVARHWVLRTLFAACVLIISATLYWWYLMTPKNYKLDLVNYSAYVDKAGDLVLTYSTGPESMWYCSGYTLSRRGNTARIDFHRAYYSDGIPSYSDGVIKIVQFKNDERVFINGQPITISVGETR